MTQHFRIVEISRIEDLVDIRPGWNELYQRCAAATPFQSPESLIAWWRSFGNSKLYVLAVYSGADLRGLAPFYIDDNAGGDERRLLGSGVSDYLDVLADPDGDQGVGSAVLNHLLRCAELWDVCDFQNLPSNSILIHTRVPGGLQNSLTSDSICPVLELPSSAETYMNCLRPNARHNIRRVCRRILDSGAVSVEWAREPSQVPEFLDALFRLHGCRWMGRGHTGVLADPRVQQLHRDAAGPLWERGELEIAAVPICK
jgi:CelD/BcsL family acetyltransferase involved in cellulose biosynthesis